MSEPILKIDRVHHGRIDAWFTPASATGALPDLELMLDGVQLGAAVLDATAGPDGRHRVTARIPAEAISDGVAVLILREMGGGQALAHIPLIAGAPLHDDLHSEVALLRAELDMLKSVLRRHLRHGT